jgi:hypothetical protein
MGKLALTTATLVACFSIAHNTAALNLPPSPATVTIQNGTRGFFDFSLSGVPPGYDVRNRTYAAWCVTLFLADPTTGGVVHEGILLDTLSPGLPTPFGAIPWDKINYLLNHKQGSISDIQYALWHFTDGFAPDAAVSPAAIDMIADTDAHGSGFVPGQGEIIAVAVLWQGTAANLQGCIIEVPSPGTSPGVPPAPGPDTPVCPDRFTAGGFIYVNGSKANFGIQGGYQKGRLWGGINYIDHGTGMHVRGRTATSYVVIDETCRQATYDVTIDGQPGTATVIVCDHGEPGVHDMVEIVLSNGYAAGTGTTLGADGSGGGNVQLHKAKCHDSGATVNSGGQGIGGKGGKGHGKDGNSGGDKGPRNKGNKGKSGKH